MKNIYTQPKVSVLTFNSLDIITSSAEDVKNIFYNNAGGLSDIVPY